MYLNKQIKRDCSECFRCMWNALCTDVYDAGWHCDGPKRVDVLEQKAEMFEHIIKRSTGV
jgi:hypothetical protein